jgi:hypothetical protein
VSLQATRLCIWLIPCRQYYEYRCYVLFFGGNDTITAQLKAFETQIRSKIKNHEFVFASRE